MKALVRKHGFTPTTKEQDEVFLESSWLSWIQADGRPLTDENMGYALCEDCPEDVELTPEDFEVTEHTKTVKDDMGEDVEVKYWIAEYVKK